MVVTPRRVPTLLLLAVKGVVGVCAEPQVRRGATAWVIARMTDEVVAGVGACGEEICEAVRQMFSPAEAKKPVAFLNLHRGPFKTSLLGRHGGDFDEESELVRLRKQGYDF